MGTEYHRRKAITFRPETEADERWLDQLAERSGETMNAVMRRIVRDARLLTRSSVTVAASGGGGGGCGAGGGYNSASGATGSPG
jgi:hypothetical protein